MKGLVIFGFLISTIIVCVLSEDGSFQQDSSAVVTSSDQLTHGHRSKRSPYDPVVPALLLGKSFLLGAFLGKSLKRGWGWRPRHHHKGWHSHAWSAPVVVHHHSHGGWGGWSEPEVHHHSSGGWGGWSR